MPFTSIQNNLCSITVLIFKIKIQRICNDCKVQHQVPSVKWPLPLFVHTINKGTSDSLLANEFWMVFCLQDFLQSSWHLILASWNWHFILQKKINEMCFTNNQDLWYVLKWSVGFFLTFLSAWALKGHQLCFGTRLLHADRGKGLDCCLTTNNPQTLLISLPPQLWGMENGILQKRHRGEGQYWKVTFLEVNIKYSDSSFTWHHWRFTIIFWSRCYYSNMWMT